jgi:hypothetical protein
MVGDGDVKSWALARHRGIEPVMLPDAQGCAKGRHYTGVDSSRPTMPATIELVPEKRTPRSLLV